MARMGSNHSCKGGSAQPKHKRRCEKINFLWAALVQGNLLQECNICLPPDPAQEPVTAIFCSILPAGPPPGLHPGVWGSQDTPQGHSSLSSWLCQVHCRKDTLHLFCSLQFSHVKAAHRIRTQFSHWIMLNPSGKEAKLFKTYKN